MKNQYAFPFIPRMISGLLALLHASLLAQTTTELTVAVVTPTQEPASGTITVGTEWSTIGTKPLENGTAHFVLSGGPTGLIFQSFSQDKSSEVLFHVCPGQSIQTNEGACVDLYTVRSTGDCFKAFPVDYKEFSYTVFATRRVRHFTANCRPLRPG